MAPEIEPHVHAIAKLIRETIFARGAALLNSIQSALQGLVCLRQRDQEIAEAEQRFLSSCERLAE
jgi:hypothetical protein